MVLGVAAHEAVETNYRQKLGTKLDLPISDVTDAFADAFSRLTEDVEDDPEESMGAAKDSGVTLVKEYQKVVAPTVQPLFVEQEVQFRLDSVPYTGFIDLVDQNRQVRDLKTTKRKPSDRTSYALAMTGYAVGYRQLTGHVEAGVTLDYMVRTQKPYYYPASSAGPITDVAIAGFSQILTGVSERVQRGIFLPTGLNHGACGWCGYRDICPAFKSSQ